MALRDSSITFGRGLLIPVGQPWRDFLSNYQNSYNVSKNYALSNFDTPWNVNFTLVYTSSPRCPRCRNSSAEGWQLNSIFRAQKGRPIYRLRSRRSIHQGVRTTYVELRWKSAQLRLPQPGRILQYRCLLGGQPTDSRKLWPKRLAPARHFAARHGQFSRTLNSPSASR